MENKCKKCKHIKGDFNSGNCECLNEDLSDNVVELFMGTLEWNRICPGFGEVS